MTGKQLRLIRDQMDLTQAELAERLKVARNSVARMENGRQAITPSMELLISFVAEAGVEATSHSRAGSRTASDKRKHRGNTRTPGRKNRRG
jgi:transcriptional regulator with XRE-family HTH domain